MHGSIFLFVLSSSFSHNAITMTIQHIQNSKKHNPEKKWKREFTMLGNFLYSSIYIFYGLHKPFVEHLFIPDSLAWQHASGQQDDNCKLSRCCIQRCI